MAYLVAFAPLVVVILLLAAMPWKRPHPNHVFIFTMLARWSDENPDLSCEAQGNTRSQSPVEVSIIRRDTDLHTN